MQMRYVGVLITNERYIDCESRLTLIHRTGNAHSGEVIIQDFWQLRRKWIHMASFIVGLV
jgi:hypothetical protein